MITISRTIIAILLGFISSIFLGFVVVPLFKKYKLGQSVSHMLSERHLAKDGTPTMGGVIFLVPTVILATCLFANYNIKPSLNFLIIVLTFILYGLSGFIDDFLKIKYRNNKGISIMTKFSFELIIALLFFFLFIISGNSTTISLGLFKIDLKYLYGVFILFVLTGTTNAVNITDGLDGLCAGISIIVLLSYGIISWHSTYIIGYDQIAVFCFILVGSLLGFLFFNFYPAKIFMGDLGSLSLGGAIAAIAIVLKKEFSLVILGIVFIIETLSSLIQIISIKLFNRKVFLKSPLHHHFEELGYSESEIIKIFYLMASISSLIALVIYIWR